MARAVDACAAATFVVSPGSASTSYSSVSLETMTFHRPSASARSRLQPAVCG